jgi:hypothetical protein
VDCVAVIGGNLAQGGSTGPGVIAAAFRKTRRFLHLIYRYRHLL